MFIFAGAKFGENVLKWDTFNYATKFRAMAIYVILFECEIIIRGLHLFAHLTSSQRKRKLNTHQNNHLYGKIGFFFWISTLISVTAEKWSYTSYLFFTPVRQIIVL